MEIEFNMQTSQSNYTETKLQERNTSQHHVQRKADHLQGTLHLEETWGTALPSFTTTQVLQRIYRKYSAHTVRLFIPSSLTEIIVLVGCIRRSQPSQQSRSHRNLNYPKMSDWMCNVDFITTTL